MSNEAFLGLRGMFVSDDPPNAAMTYDAGGETSHLILELYSPEASSEGIVYRVRILDGDPPPAQLGQFMLLIDSNDCDECSNFASTSHESSTPFPSLETPGVK